VNARRFIEFLLLEHMAKGGQQNGKIKAPARQLHDFGIGEHYVTGAINQAEEVGLVDCRRQGVRAATLYGLTWMESHDGTRATNRWRDYRNPNLTPLRTKKSRNLPAKQQTGLSAKRQTDGHNLSAKQQTDELNNLPAKRQALLRESLTTVGAVFSEGEEPCRLSSRSASPPCGGGLLRDCIEHGMILDEEDLDAAAGDPSACFRLHPYRRPSSPEGSRICIGAARRGLARGLQPRRRALARKIVVRQTAGVLAASRRRRFT
jgi:hypothetical protein